MMTSSGMLIQCARRIAAGCARRARRRVSAATTAVVSLQGGENRSGVVALADFRSSTGCASIYISNRGADAGVPYGLGLLPTWLIGDGKGKGIRLRSENRLCAAWGSSPAAPGPPWLRLRR